MSIVNAVPLLEAAGGDYTIARSVRFRSSASAYLNRTPASAGNRKTWTYSLWVKRGKLGPTLQKIFECGNSSSDYLTILFNGTGSGSVDDRISLYSNVGGAMALYVEPTPIYRDPSAWYHFVFAIDTTQATASNRVKVYANGLQVTALSATTYPSLNVDLPVNNTVSQNIGPNPAISSQYFDGYMAEVNFIDGQALTPSSFGETDSITGVWKAKKYSGTYGTNGFYLNFSDNSNNTATTIGKDLSGNANNWTPNNISVTTGATYDSMVDSPTVSAVSSNYCVMNPLKLQANMRLTNGNLDVSSTDTGSAYCAFSSIVMSSGSWYAEYTINTSSGNYPQAGIGDLIKNPNTNEGLGDSNGTAYQRDGRVIVNGTTIGTFATFTNGDVIGVAYDATNNRIYFAKNNTYINSGNPSGGTGYFSPASPVLGYVFGTALYSVGSCSVNFGQRPFAYTPPTGFVALNTNNLPASTIKNGAAYMAATTWTGTGATNSISNAVNGVSFQPDFVWQKSRSNAYGHKLYDSVRGTTKQLSSESTSAESTTDATYLTSFNSGGFTVGSDTGMNGSGATFVGWQWKAGGTAVSNTDGTITTTVSASPSSGFSVMTYTGTGIDNKTIGHGLGAAPKFIIWKPRASATDWMVWHAGLSGYNYDVRLNTTAAQGTGANPLNNTAPSSTVITLRNQGDVNGSGTSIVCYAFAAVAGYSAFGSYTGNGSADGPFVYTGFRPRFILYKVASGSLGEWVMLDSSRNTYNVEDAYLFANSSGAEATFTILDFLSNGFKLRTSNATSNGSGNTYIYACFSENPFKNSLAR